MEEFVEIQGTSQPTVKPPDTTPGSVTGYSKRTISDLVNSAFRIRQTDTLEVSVGPGSVNGVVPTLGGTSLSAEPSPTVNVGGMGPSVAVYLLGEVETADPADFGNLLSITVEVISSGNVPESTFANPARRIGTVNIASGRINTIVQEVNSSLMLLRWYDYNVWLPGGV